MKHRQLVEVAKSLLEEIALSVDDEALSLAVEHLEWVLERNTTLNLTAITDPEEAIRLHVVDSLTALPLVNACIPGKLCDMGSGAGFPGVPLSLASGRQTIVVDSVAKKMHALAEFVQARKLSLQIATETDRLEVLAQRRPAAFAVVTARALAPLPSLVELAAPLLAPGGSLVAMKARLSADELGRGDRVSELVGLRRTEMTELCLPRTHEARVLVTYERVSDPKVPLPRRVGMAQKRALG